MQLGSGERNPAEREMLRKERCKVDRDVGASEGWGAYILSRQYVSTVEDVGASTLILKLEIQQGERELAQTESDAAERG
jgi:hypothetical protein